MIAADSGSLVAYLAGNSGADVDNIQAAIDSGELFLPPVVVTELLSDPRSAAMVQTAIARILMLDIREGYWARAGETRQALHRRGLKARVGDTLIAQSCIDHDVALITRDRDFRHYAKHAGLKLA